MENRPTTWDEQKARQNLSKHGVSFEEAQTVFNDPFAIMIRDVRIAYEENRWFALGLTVSGKLLAVWYTERADSIRIIGARKATKGERRNYEHEQHH